MRNPTNPRFKVGEIKRKIFMIDALKIKGCLGRPLAPLVTKNKGIR